MGRSQIKILQLKDRPANLTKLSRTGLINHPPRYVNGMKPALLAGLTVGRMSSAEFMRPVVAIKTDNGRYGGMTRV